MCVCVLLITDMKLSFGSGVSDLTEWICPRGHRYYIGECGRPMQESRCHCGALIGGAHHKPVPGVAPSTKPDALQHPRGYVLYQTDTNQHLNYRQRSSISMRILRCFVHLILFFATIISNRNAVHRCLFVYMCVCVCVYMCVYSPPDLRKAWLKAAAIKNM